MGSLEIGVTFKKDVSFRSLSSKIERNHSRNRSRFSRLLLPHKLGYYLWVCLIVVFSLFLVVFQFFLPGSVVESPGNSVKVGRLVSWEAIQLRDFVGDLDFGENLRFEPKCVLGRVRREAMEFNSSSGSKSVARFGHRKPLLALVFTQFPSSLHNLSSFSFCTFVHCGLVDLWISLFGIAEY